MTGENPFLNKTDTIARPTRESDPHLSAQALAERQHQWDEAKRLKAHMRTLGDRARADRTARETERREAHERQDAARRDRKRSAIEDRLRGNFLAAGGTAEDWDAERDRLVREELGREATEGAAAARRRQQVRTVRAF